MIEINGKEYKELRCNQCQKFICYLNALAADICYQCPRCGKLNEFSFKFLNVPSVLAFVLRWYSIDKTRKQKGEK